MAQMKDKIMHLLHPMDKRGMMPGNAEAANMTTPAYTTTNVPEAFYPGSRPVVPAETHSTAPYSGALGHHQLPAGMENHLNKPTAPQAGSVPADSSGRLGTPPPANRGSNPTSVGERPTEEAETHSSNPLLPREPGPTNDSPAPVPSNELTTTEPGPTKDSPAHVPSPGPPTTEPPRTDPAADEYTPAGYPPSSGPDGQTKWSPSGLQPDDAPITDRTGMPGEDRGDGAFPTVADAGTKNYLPEVGGNPVDNREAETPWPSTAEEKVEKVEAEEAM